MCWSTPLAQAVVAPVDLNDLVVYPCFAKPVNPLSSKILPAAAAKVAQYGRFMDNETVLSTRNGFARAMLYCKGSTGPTSTFSCFGRNTSIHAFCTLFFLLKKATLTPSAGRISTSLLHKTLRTLPEDTSNIAASGVSSEGHSINKSVSGVIAFRYRCLILKQLFGPQGVNRLRFLLLLLLLGRGGGVLFISPQATQWIFS